MIIFLPDFYFDSIRILLCYKRVIHFVDSIIVYVFIVSDAICPISGAVTGRAASALPVPRPPLQSERNATRKRDGRARRARGSRSGLTGEGRNSRFPFPFVFPRGG